jgi:hypothetical protein
VPSLPSFVFNEFLGSFGTALFFSGSFSRNSGAARKAGGGDFSVDVSGRELEILIHD